MAYIPVILNDGTDLLSITTSMRRGSGDIIIRGPVSLEIESEIQKVIRFAAALADMDEFTFPDLSSNDLHISFKCQRSGLPIAGTSYGLGLGVALLCLFAGRNPPADSCFTGCLGDDGAVLPVEAIDRKRTTAASAGFTRIFLPDVQLDFLNGEIRQVPVESIYQAWGVLNYGT